MAADKNLIPQDICHTVRLPKDKSKDKKVIVNEGELKRMYELELKGIEKTVRDKFLAQAWS
jgi:hypothetical protein